MTDPTQQPATPASTTLLHAPDGVGYRLLELPDELVHADTKWSVSSQDGLARLSAGGRTYAMRQKNTSNALILLQSSRARGGDAAAAAAPALTAVATVHETVELVEEAAPAAAAAAAAAAAPKPKNKWHDKFGRTR